jgi:AraC-like DNA-binding protein/mannose-6-phosphate isomerase-like protein (cupin superfamily)
VAVRAKKARNTSKYSEDVSHMTDSRPYSIHHTKTEPGTKTALYLHCHNEMEFLFLLDGKLEFHIEESVYLMGSNQAIFIPPNHIHYALDVSGGKSGCEYYAVVFSAEMLSSSALTQYTDYFSAIGLVSNSGLRVFDEEKDATIIGALNMIFSCIDKPAMKSELLVRGQLLTIWQEIYNEFLYSPNAGVSRINAAGGIQRAVEFICENYAEDISLAALAETAGLSEGHFCRKFKGITGFSPFEFINRQRIMRACELLMYTDERIADIATHCGYNNISYFNRTFNKCMRETPKQYRNQRKDQSMIE